MSKSCTISTARNQLFELFDEVTSVEGQRVIIGRRNRPKQAVLVAKDYLDHLEFASRQMRGAPAGRFVLYGSASLRVPPEQVLEATRREQETEAAAKWRFLRGRTRVRGSVGQSGSH